LTALERIRPLVENYLESMDHSEENYIRNPRFSALSHEFSECYFRQLVKQRRFQNIKTVCKAIRDTLTEMCEHNTTIGFEAVRMKCDTTINQMKLEQLADRFLDFYDELLDIWNTGYSGRPY